VWADLGLPPRLVVDVAVSAPLVPPLVTELAPPAEGMHLGIGRGGPGGLTPTGPRGPQRPAASGLPVARPDQHWRSRQVDEQAEAAQGGQGGDAQPSAPPSAATGPGGGTEQGGTAAAIGRGAPTGPGAQIRLRRRISTSDKD
jgi:hypothetical protein